MQAEPPRGFRGFLQSRIGRVVFILGTIGVVFATIAYVSDGAVIAIPIFLIVGLGLPIYAGLKRPRFLALAGVIVLIAVAPLATVVLSQEILVPPSSASSPGLGPWEVGGAVLQNATISPFTGSPTTLFTWTVAVYPKYLNASFAGTNWSKDEIQLFLSTCPGATAGNLTYCRSLLGSSYPFAILNYTFSGRPANGAVVTFQHQVAGNGIWSWQMELVLANGSNPANASRIELVGDPTYDGLEGPILGGFSVVYGALILPMYELDLIYLGIPFFFVLLLYAWFKGREARRKELVRRALAAKAASSAPGGSGTAGAAPPAAPGGPPGGSSGPVSSELACPNCGAVVYPNEAKCWKCGGALGGPPASSAPLPSKPPGQS